MKRTLLFLTMIFVVSNTYSQQKKLYDPTADARADIQAILKIAAAQNKHVLLQAGGNWCGWCIEYDRFCKSDVQIDSLLKSNFILYHLNWSKENENRAIFRSYGYPQRFGFPVLIVLNANGDRIHIQNSEYLEDGNKSYNREKVVSFLKNWSPSALDRSNYND